MLIGQNLINLRNQEKREKIEQDIPGKIIELQEEIEWLKKDNAMLKGQILTLLDLINMTQDLAKLGDIKAQLGDIKAQRDAFVAMADCIKPILKIGEEIK